MENLPDQSQPKRQQNHTSDLRSHKKTSYAYLQQLQRKVLMYERDQFGSVDQDVNFGNYESPEYTGESYGTPSRAKTATETNAGLPKAGDMLNGSSVAPILNPLSGPKSFIIDESRRQRHLGSSSTWAFSIQVCALLRTQKNGTETGSWTPVSEGASYGMATLPFQRERMQQEPLPSLTQAKYLITIFLFHLGPLYHFFKEDQLNEALATIYDKAVPKQEIPVLWRVQILLAIAMARLILGRGASKLGPPGVSAFLDATNLLPDVKALYSDQVLSIGILSLIALYLQSADMRTAAHVYIGQAQRLALSIGLHRETPAGILDPRESEHRRRLWWTVYIVDIKLSVNMGCPLPIQNKDIDVSLPEQQEDDNSHLSLKMHLKLAGITGKVMDVAYGLNGYINTTFILGIQEVLASMSRLTREFDEKFHLNLLDPGEVSRVTATLHLSYYQGKFSGGPSWGNKSISEPVEAILKTGVGAAFKMISILSVLHEQNLIDPFLPFDIEAVFSSAVTLVLMTVAYPSIQFDESLVPNANRILDWICSRGNEPAKARQRDLKELSDLASSLRPNQSHTLSDEALNHDSDWLWNALGMEQSTMERDDNTRSIVLMNHAILDSTMTDESLEQQWFWDQGEVPNIL